MATESETIWDMQEVGDQAAGTARVEDCISENMLFLGSSYRDEAVQQLNPFFRALTPGSGFHPFTVSKQVCSPHTHTHKNRQP